MAAEAAFTAIGAGRTSDELAAYPEAYEASWVYEELRGVRNVVPLVKKFGGTWGTVFAGIAMWSEVLGIRWPFTMKHKPDYKYMHRAAASQPIDYPKPDGVLSFDKLSSVFLSNTNHEEDQPIHLTLKDPDVPIHVNLPLWAEPAQRYCPAGVYEVIGEGDDARFQINAQNCVHCKTCDIKDPSQNINWVVPEGGGGPNYPNM